METQTTLSDNGGAPPTLAQSGVVKTRCSNKLCGREDRWLDENFPRPDRCVECNAPLIVVAATGETVEQAIAAAAQALPDRVEPVQPTLPGLRPLFDLAGALTMIEDAAQEARVAEAAYEGAKAVAKRRRDAADQANTTLRDLIRDLAARRHDARYETQADTDAGSQPDLQQLHDRDERADDVSAVRDSGAADGAALVQEAGAEPAGEVDGELFTSDELPRDEDAVIDCSNAGTLALLHQAGADKIILEQVEAWGEGQVVMARAWALEQIEANQQAEPGHVVSVYWPEHVSRAHHGPATHTPKKRTKRAKTPKR